MLFRSLLVDSGIQIDFCFFNPLFSSGTICLKGLEAHIKPPVTVMVICLKFLERS